MAPSLYYDYCIWSCTYVFVLSVECSFHYFGFLSLFCSRPLSDLVRIQSVDFWPSRVWTCAAREKRTDVRYLGTVSAPWIKSVFCTVIYLLIRHPQGTPVNPNPNLAHIFSYPLHLRGYLQGDPRSLQGSVIHTELPDVNRKRRLRITALVPQLFRRKLVQTQWTGLSQEYICVTWNAALHLWFTVQRGTSAISRIRSWLKTDGPPLHPCTTISLSRRCQIQNVGFLLIAELLSHPPVSDAYGGSKLWRSKGDAEHAVDRMKLSRQVQEQDLRGYL